MGRVLWVRPTQGDQWVGRVLGLYGPPFAGRPMGPQGPIKGYHVTVKRLNQLVNYNIY
jgi:hypothetical protein